MKLELIVDYLMTILFLPMKLSMIQIMKDTLNYSHIPKVIVYFYYKYTFIQKASFFSAPLWSDGFPTKYFGSSTITMW